MGRGRNAGEEGGERKEGATGVRADSTTWDGAVTLTVEAAGKGRRAVRLGRFEDRIGGGPGADRAEGTTTRWSGGRIESGGG